MKPARRRDTRAHGTVAALGWMLAGIGVVGLIAYRTLLVVWVAMIAFGVAAIPRALIEWLRDRK